MLLTPVYTVMERNFILTDLMGTGNHVDYERFISLNTLQNQSFTLEGEYYKLHGYDLDSYDRRIALIDRTIILAQKHYSNNIEYQEELARRRKLLHSQGFVFVLCTPWESKSNIEGLNLYPPVEKKELIWSGDVSWFWFYMYQKYHNNELNFQHMEKKFDFLFLNKQTRPHREKLYEKIQKTNLLNDSLYTYWPVGKKLPKDFELPWVEKYPFRGMDQQIFEKPYNETKYSLISETNDNNTDVFITEKLWKAIIAQHIFVVHGNYLYLQKLRELGFQTFSKYFDESYDLEKDPDKRITKIIETCSILKEKNWEDLYLQTQSIRKHNYNMFLNKEKLSEQVNKQLNLFLEFADSSQVSS